MSRAMLRELPLAKLKLLYHKLFPIPEVTTASPTQTSSSKESSLTVPSSPATGNTGVVEPSLTLPTSTVDGKHIS